MNPITVGMKCTNEAKIAHRCIADFHDDKWVKEIVVLDGESTDFTIYELKKFPKVRVHTLKWQDTCPHQETVSSNALLGYIRNGEIVFILDFDERISPDLRNFLYEVYEGRHLVSELCGVHFSRRTFELIRYENSPHAMIGEDGWPLTLSQTGQYPDYQNRMFIKNYHLHWVNSPHHVLCGHKSEFLVNADIWHYEKEDFRDRINLEKKWLLCQAIRNELGLTADVFETQVKPELAEYSDMEGWR